MATLRPIFVDEGSIMNKSPNRDGFLKAIGLLAVSLALAVLPMTAGVAEALDRMENWPELKALLHSEADKRPVTLSRGASVTLDARQAVLAPDLSLLQVSPVNDSTVQIPANGVLTFAVDVTEPMYVAGSVSIAADPADLRPGLRAYVLSDTTVVGAPMIYQKVPEGNTQIEFDLPGEMPAKKAVLRSWRLEPGRHYLSIAGPHYRAAGIFESLELQGLRIVPETPKYTFVQLSDTHVCRQRPAVTSTLIYTFRLLQKQGVAFAIISGDMTNVATHKEFEILATVVKKSDGFPIYGCVGNHDAYKSSSRPDMLKLVPEIFPGGKTNYVLNKPPLRFVVVDAAYWMTAEGQAGNIASRWSDYFPGSDSPRCGMGPEGIKWFRRTLAADTTTPSVIVSHFPFELSQGETQCGYRVDELAAADRELEPFIKAAPNVVATLSGHMHWNHLETYENDSGDDITSFQGPAFCVWPSGYKMFRVYSDGDRVRLECELRLVDNMGHVAKGLSSSPSLSWRISTSHERDLVSEPGGIELTRERR
jgi:predicted MPP superfamily phosphohydrolase